MQTELHFDVSELLHVTDSEARFRLSRDPLERAARLKENAGRKEPYRICQVRSITSGQGEMDPIQLMGRHGVSRQSWPQTSPAIAGS
jgi:hypothetical protein